MNDRDLYKAKRIDNKEWIAGNYMFPDRIYDYISKIAYQIDLDTLRRCTGLKDKNGKLIWEDDTTNNAYEKQTPKKPAFWSDGYADGQLAYDTWFCPGCGEEYELDYDEYKYCPECGQAIDWGGAENETE